MVTKKYTVRVIFVTFVSHKLHVIHQNINGLLNKVDLLSVALNEIEETQKITIDVVCITEHNLINSDINLLKLPNFTLASRFLRESRNGGSCILVRNNHNFKELQDLTKFSMPNLIECSGIQLLGHNIVIMCIYRPPKFDKFTVDIFFNKLQEILKIYGYDKKRKLIICGDINLDILKRNKTILDLEDLLSGFNLKLLLNEPTRLVSGTCIDNFISNIKKSKCNIEELALSDHTAQIFTCDVKAFSYIKHFFIEKRDYSNENMRKFQECIRSLSFNEVYETHDPEEAFNKFYDLFKLFYDLCFPKIKVKISLESKSKWMTKGIKRCSKRKRELLWKYRKAPDSRNKSNFKNYSKRLKKVINLTQKAQNDYRIKTSLNKSKATWDIINNKFKNNLLNNSIAQIKKDGNIITSPDDIAQAFNDHFVKRKSNRDCKHKINWSRLKSMFMGPSVPQDIVTIIKTLKNTTSTGYDEISTKIIKSVNISISSILSYIINLCVESGVFPDKLKTSVVKPLFKRGDTLDLDCYRPVSLIPIFSKIIEKYIHKNLYDYMELNEIIADEQIGFRKKKTINLAIYNFVKKVMVDLDKKELVCALFMDLTKAFDYVNHRILENKLYAYGVRGNSLALIKSYLNERYQITEIKRVNMVNKTEEKYFSDVKKIDTGVPQGSVLGPLLFITYINDFPASTDHQMILFADDSTVIFTGKNKMTLQNDISNAMENIISWLTSNNLLINLDKTNIMAFKTRKRNLPPLDIKYSGTEIKEIKNTKFLGLYIDDCLSWETQIDNVCLKLNRFSFALYMLSKVVNQNAVRIAYDSYVTATLRYGIIFWGNAANRDRAFKSQKRCIRSICHLQTTDSCKPYFQKLKILPCPCLYIYEVVVFIRTNENLFEFSENARRKNKICFTQHSSAIFGKSIINMAPRIYNKLPGELADRSLSITILKRKLKEFLIKKCYYSINEYFDDKQL